MTRTKPANVRTHLHTVAFCLILATVAVVGVRGLTSGSDGRPSSTGGGGSTPSTQKYFFMTEGDGAFAKLQMDVNPAGQITGTHFLVRFSDDTGEPRPMDPEQFRGTVTDERLFKLTGLSNTRPYKGALKDDILTLDGTFGVSKLEWTQIPSADAFDEAVDAHTKLLEGCEQDYLGCAE